MKSTLFNICYIYLHKLFIGQNQASFDPFQKNSMDVHVSACFLLIIISPVLSEESKWIFNGTISSNDTYIWPPTLMKPLPLIIFNITYKVMFKASLCHQCLHGKDMCCPQFLINNWRVYLKYGRNASCEEQLSLFSKPTAFNNYNIILNYKPEFQESGCNLIENDTVSCTKTMSFGRSSSTLVSFTFAACNSSVGIHLSYEVTFRSTRAVCYPNPMAGICEDYTRVGLPGTLGFNTLGELLKYTTVLKFALQSFSACHQRSSGTICRTFLPECDSQTNRLILPCRKQCEEVLLACRDEIQKFGVHFSCKMYLNTTDEKLCFYEPVECPEPKNPQNGNVKFSSYTWNSTANYSCDSKLFLMSGPAVRKCNANGTWDNPSPTCTINYNILIAIILPLAVIIFLIILFIYLIGKRRIHFKPTEEWLKQLYYDAYVSYCNDDSEFVEGSFRETLEEEQDPPFKIFLHNRDILPGSTHLESILNAITQSVTCLILVSRSSMQDGLHQFEFKIAHKRIVDEGFPPSSLILVFLDDIPVEDLPDGIKAIYYTCTVIRRSNPFFWRFLVRAIKQAKKDMKVFDGLTAYGSSNQQTAVLVNHQYTE